MKTDFYISKLVTPNVQFLAWFEEIPLLEKLFTKYNCVLNEKTSLDFFTSNWKDSCGPALSVQLVYLFPS